MGSERRVLGRLGEEQATYLIAMYVVASGEAVALHAVSVGLGCLPSAYPGQREAE